MSFEVNTVRGRKLIQDFVKLFLKKWGTAHPDFRNAFRLERLKLLLDELLVPSWLFLVTEPEVKSKFVMSTVLVDNFLEAFEQR